LEDRLRKKRVERRRRTQLLVRNRKYMYNVFVLPTLLYGSENLNMKTKTKSRIVTAEMKFKRKFRL
jgi:hypothetical protein